MSKPATQLVRVAAYLIVFSSVLVLGACEPPVADTTASDGADDDGLHRKNFRHYGGGTTTAPTGTTTPSTPDAATAPSSTPDAATAPSPPAGTRDPLKQPFASNSIWNTPIGSSAVYVPANLRSIPGGSSAFALPWADEEYIFMQASAPLTQIRYSGGGWGGDRCATSGSKVIATVPMASSFVVPSLGTNAAAAFLAADGHTVVQTEPFARCTAGAAATSLIDAIDVDIAGDGIRGAHGGSGLSSIGGSLRMGELRPGDVGVRHALKMAVYMKEAYKCTTASACYRWPAVTGDSYAVGFYGTGAGNPNVGNTALKMGALLAIPANTAITSLGLETEPAKQIAWTLQNYGAYIVDDSYDPAFYFDTENGPAGRFTDQFESDYGVAFNQDSGENVAWVRDIKRLLPALSVIDNNTASSIGGGGTPRQALAPAL